MPFFSGMRAVEPRERLHRVHAAELLVHVHRVQQRLVEAGLELVGDDQEAVLGPLEGLGGLRLREAVHAGLGVGLAAVLDRPREGDQRLERIAALGEVLVDRQPVAHRVQARARDDHRLGLAADLALHLRGEVLDHDPHLLADRVRVQLDERLEQVLGLLLVVARVVLDLLQQPPVGRVGRVVREHVEDEALLDRLAHAVEVEGLELPVGALACRTARASSAWAWR